MGPLKKISRPEGLKKPPQTTKFANKPSISFGVSQTAKIPDRKVNPPNRVTAKSPSRPSNTENPYITHSKSKVAWAEAEQSPSSKKKQH